MITGTILLDLTRDRAELDRRKLVELIGLPSGVRVAIHVGDRRYPPASTVGLMDQAAEHLLLDVHGSARAVTAWVGALQQPVMVRGERR